MKEKKYVAEKIENFQAEIPVEEYMKECVDVATFLEFCKECSNYGNYGAALRIHLMWKKIIGTNIAKFKLWGENYICLKNLQASPILKMNNGK